MFTRHLLILSLLFAALVLDLGLPVWSSAPFLPSCLDLAFLAVCVGTSGASTVFWAGLTGAGYEFVNSSPMGLGIMSAATLAIVVAYRTREHDRHRSVVDRVLASLVLLVLLELFRTLLGAVWDPTRFPPILPTLGARLAVTFLVAAVLCLGLAGWRLSVRSRRLLAGHNQWKV